MLFNSFPFAVFFGIFFILYWGSRSRQWQNVLILAGSYVFYAWWDWRFLFLLAGSSLLHWLLGIAIERSGSEKRKRLFLLIGLIEGIGVLILYKYVNLLAVPLSKALAGIGIAATADSFSWLFPLGLSFYTFRLVGYLLDVHKGKQRAVKGWIVFFSFAAFFPCLVSGPIDKARTLVPQLESPRSFEYLKAVSGLRQFLWGLFKKLVIANNCAVLVDPVFANYQHLPASSLLLGAFLYAMQIYADFSGYSDMALGTARLLGFEVTKNF
ncbi:MAG: MBOAT family protein, partial [Chitinophagaceae bacterium]|nr:MBOAT family protein [Chitinophagaceae bacterium]